MRPPQIHMLNSPHLPTPTKVMVLGGDPFGQWLELDEVVGLLQGLEWLETWGFLLSALFEKTPSVPQEVPSYQAADLLGPWS